MPIEKYEYRILFKECLPAIKNIYGKVETGIEQVKELVNDTREVLGELKQELKSNKINKVQATAPEGEERVEMNAYYYPETDSYDITPKNNNLN